LVTAEPGESLTNGVVVAGNAADPDGSDEDTVDVVGPPPSVPDEPPTGGGGSDDDQLGGDVAPGDPPRGTENEGAGTLPRTGSATGMLVRAGLLIAAAGAVVVALASRRRA